MRIVVVSAHYPPNFVSGGTLQPQRLARGLRRRGHDVSVYAGWLGEERSPGEGWDDVDETGLPVRWIASTPWTGWDDRRNYDNPLVAADFARFLAAVAPDVVHLHSLQSLGAGLVDAAADAGAGVVVTMHDFWWCCGRQFLVDRDLRPCSPVVEAGSCACSKDRPWLLERNRWLRDRLARADLVLAPSTSATALLRANGLAPGRLDADENGFPAALDPPTRPQRAEDDPVRFLYAGGSDVLKGVHVALEAARLLGDLGGWELRAYGAAAWAIEDGRDWSALPVALLEPFAPAEADAVFAEADVLLLPSVMRESHSLLTREALARGLAVVTSDSVGPEEVVVDGTNGLVVPTGDVEALAGAMRRFVREPGLLARLAARTTEVQLRSLDDQLDGLERRFEAVLAHRATEGGGPDRGADRPGVRSVLFVVGIDGAPLRYRVRLPQEALALRGVESSVLWFTDPRLGSAAAEADVVVVYRSPATPQLLEVIDGARQRGTPVLFDADDLIFDPRVADEIPALRILPPDAAALWLDGVRRYRTTLEHCDGYVASTPALARRAADLGFVAERFENGVGLVLAQVAERAAARPRRPGPLRIGYFSGTDTHDLDWASIEPAVIEVLEQHPSVELWLGGHLVTTEQLAVHGARVHRLPFVPWTELPDLLRDVDVNLAPLAAGAFNEAKSAIKWLEAALVGTPTVASPTEPYRDAVDDGRTGHLADGHDAWVRSVSGLLADADRRRLMGARARRDALLRWSPHVQAERYLDILERARPAARASRWEDHLGHEAVAARALEPYSSALVTPSVAERIGVRAADLRHRIGVAKERHGVLGGAARLPRAAVRAARRRRG